MNKENDNKMVLKFRAISEKLDWQGNVIEDIKENDYDWIGYDPKQFLDSVIKKGDLSCVPSPVGAKYATDFFKYLFPELFPKGKWINEWDVLRKYKVVESVPFNECKFVIYSRKYNKSMFWTMED